MLRRLMMAGGGAVGDPYYADVRSLLLMGGPNASTAFTDEKGIIWTANGDAQIDTSVKLYGTGSYRGYGSNDWIQATDAALAPGTSDFCAEMWVRKLGDTSIATNADSILLDYRAAEPSAQLEIDINGRTAAFPQEDRAVVYVNGATRIDGQDINPVKASDGFFRHVVYERIGGVGKLGVSGQFSGTSYADTNNYNSTTLFLGGRFAAVSGDRRSLNGAINRWRLTVRPGGRYGHTNFTPGDFLNY